jgi:hypothetical protein
VALRALSIAGVAACFLFAGSSTAHAQSLRVRVTAAESATPLAGAFVTLLDPAGRVVRNGLADEAGRFVFALDSAGRFTVKAELIGRQTRTSAPVDVAGDESVTVPLALPVLAVTLSEIRVETDGRCELRPDEASQIARVWDEARKPLAVQAWAEREGLHLLEITTYERDLDADGRRVVREDRRAVRRLTRVPFASLPPDDLLRGGFIREVEGGGHEYYGPDATLLLSDLFLDTHCLRLTRSTDEPGAVGLEFEPVLSAEQADIRGVLWLDERTTALRHIEYTYTRAPWIEAVGVAGGRVEYEPLADGAWVIERWWIRAPIMGRRADLARAGDSGIRVAGIRETGGEVVGGTVGQIVAQTRLGSVDGTVWDSVASSPLVGATVFLSGTTHRAETDSDGRFALDALPAGTYMVGFRHDRLDSLGVVPAIAEAEVTPGLTSEVALAIPSRETLVLAACRTEERVEGGSVLTGTVTDRTSGRPVPGARVRVEWQEVERMRPMVQARPHFLEVRADHDGRYTACGIPVDEAISVVASFLDTSGDEAATAFPEESLQSLDLTISLPAGLFDAPTGVAVLSSEYGAQGVQGTLVESGSDAPIRAAVVTIRGLSGEVVASGETNDDGFFRLTMPAPGRYLLSAQALGYGTIDAAAVDVTLGNLSVLDVRMAADALELEPIVVTAEPRAFHLEMQGFYERQKTGLGVFITPQILEERRPQRVSNLLFGVPGIRVAEPIGGRGGRVVYFRGGEGLSICWPMVYIDRHLVSTGGLGGAGAEPTAVDDIVAASDVLAIEAFRGPAEIPPEFNGPNAGCGVIVIWTRRGGGN